MSGFVKFLLSGPGLIGRQHAKLINLREDSKVSAIVAPATEDNQCFASEIGARFYTSIKDALVGERIDAAIISSPNNFHFNQAIECITKGIPTLVEKPLAASLEEALLLAEHSENLKIPVLVGHHRTYSPLLRSAYAFLNSWKFGNLVAVEGTALFYKPLGYFEEGAWRTKLGGGPILINLIHEIGLLRQLCGEIKSVFAMARSNIRKFEVEDTVVLTLEFVGGALGSFLLSDTAASSKSWEMTSGENSMYPHFPEENCYHFAGTNGSLDFPSMHARYYPDGTEPSWWKNFEAEIVPFAPENPLKLQLNHFLDVLNGVERPRVSARDGYLNMLVIGAITRSIVSRGVVEIDSVVNFPQRKTEII